MAANGFSARIFGGVASPFVGGSFAEGSLLGGVLLFLEERVLWADRDPKKCATLGAFIEWDEDCLSTGAGAADVSWG